MARTEPFGAGSEFVWRTPVVPTTARLFRVRPLTLVKAPPMAIVPLEEIEVQAIVLTGPFGPEPGVEKKLETLPDRDRPAR